ncbi:hypothetical protein O3M35_012114 [Rhynocoris fuscipes]|uniref:Endonuclease/exonuclease/phosphatase domain-containing protein n=1 Tax=Rhynocoris fuscipes TaxID=488301 RepID=A0AAW1CS06_9HEMI
MTRREKAIDKCSVITARILNSNYSFTNQVNDHVSNICLKTNTFRHIVQEDDLTSFLGSFEQILSNFNTVIIERNDFEKSVSTRDDIIVGLEKKVHSQRNSFNESLDYQSQLDDEFRLAVTTLEKENAELKCKIRELNSKLTSCEELINFMQADITEYKNLHSIDTQINDGIREIQTVKRNIAKNVSKQNNNLKAYLCIMTQNVQCLSNKIDSLNVFIRNNNNKYDVLLINEHWMCEEELDAVRINGYRLVSKSCREKRKHGGSCIFLKDSVFENFQVNVKEDLRNGFNKILDFELSLTELVCKSNKKTNLIIMTVYRSDKGKFDEFLSILDELLTEINRKGKYKIILTGDLNVNCLERSPRKDKLFDVFDSHGLVNLINEPTRMYGGTVTAIDYFITNIEQQIVQNKVLSTGFSDHLAIETIITDKLYRRPKKVIKSFTRIIDGNNIERLREALSKEREQTKTPT